MSGLLLNYGKSDKGFPCLLLSHISVNTEFSELPQMNVWLLLGNSLTSTLMLLRRVQIVSRYRAGTNNASYNITAIAGELNGRML